MKEKKKINFLGKKDYNQKKQKVKRADQFKRIKNRNEKVYGAPAFFKGHTGIQTITESGITQRIIERSTFVKAYEIKVVSENKVRENKLESFHCFYQYLCSEYVFIQFHVHRDKTHGILKNYLLVGISAVSMERAQEKFSTVEEDWKTQEEKFGINFDTLDGNERMHFYCDLISKTCGKTYQTDNYFQEVNTWKYMSGLEEVEETEDMYIKTEQGYFSVVMIQKYPYVLDDNRFIQDVLEEKFVQAVVLDAEGVSDPVVRELFHNSYVGMEGILSRMQRVNPVLHLTLTKTDEETVEDVESFVNSSASFLLRAGTTQQMEEYMNALKKIAQRHHMRIKQLCFSNADIIRAFGMTGERMDYAGQMLPKSEMGYIVPFDFEQKSEKEEAYDVEELKRLFLDEGGGA